MVALSMIASIAWAQTGPVRTVSTTLSPTGGQHGYVSDITLKYQFMYCDEIEVAVARQSIQQTAYIFEGKRYSPADVGGFPNSNTITYDISINGDVYLVTNGREQFLQAVRVVMVNNYDIGNCYTSSSSGIALKDKAAIPNLILKNVKITSRIPSEL